MRLYVMIHMGHWLYKIYIKRTDYSLSFHESRNLGVRRGKISRF